MHGHMMRKPAGPGCALSVDGLPDVSPQQPGQLQAATLPGQPAGLRAAPAAPPTPPAVPSPTLGRAAGAAGDASKEEERDADGVRGGKQGACGPRKMWQRKSRAATGP
ncbi:hypothetical protein HaLaN_11428 [Haematococcus lacustris]|uniref:Uncharacterized protein n=1 Tax=Haematococcus lacustris TaxID=44745 RepID=A0A699Z137_HAELA|nr:hypothetical protein HaLaN_11428 [Haematococcus lacustris]